MSFALPLCPPERIEEAFQLMEDEIINFGSPRIEAFAQEYLQYIRNTYMSGQFGQHPNWEWNFYNNMEDRHKTNNAAEGGNHRLMCRCKTAHPGVYRFFGVIKKELQNTFNKMEQFESGALQVTESTKSRTLQNSRMKLKNMLEQTQLTLRKYLRSQGVLNMHMKKSKTTRVPGRIEPETGDQVVDRALRGDSYFIS